MNKYGQLGLGDSVARTLFTQIPFFEGTDISAVACGDHHSAAVSSTGELFLWGQGLYGQLGHGSFTDAQTPIAFHGGRVVHPSVTLGLRPSSFYQQECLSRVCSVTQDRQEACSLSVKSKSVV